MEDKKIDSSLSSDAKLAIQKYMMRILAPSGLIIFCLIFAWNEVVKKGAILQANQNAFNTISVLTSRAESSVAKAINTVEESKKLLVEIDKTKNELKKRINEVAAETVPEEVAAILANNKDLEDAITNQFSGLIETLEENTKFISVVGSATVIDAGETWFVIQSDGNIVVYEKPEGTSLFDDRGDAKWDTGTQKKQ